MRPEKLVVRCYAEREGDQWQAFCLDLCLAAQDDTFEGAKQKLEAMIGEYIVDALCGEDKAFADQLLTRRAPLRYWLKYYSFVAQWRMGRIKDGVRRLFTETLPLQPSSNCHA